MPRPAFSVMRGKERGCGYTLLHARGLFFASLGDRRVASRTGKATMVQIDAYHRILSDKEGGGGWHAFRVFEVVFWPSFGDV